VSGTGTVHIEGGFLGIASLSEDVTGQESFSLNNSSWYTYNLTATPGSNYTFTRWNTTSGISVDDSTDSSTAIDSGFSSNQTITAVFTVNYTVSTSVSHVGVGSGGGITYRVDGYATATLRRICIYQCRKCFWFGNPLKLH
jgi:hypothetical protein